MRTNKHITYANGEVVETLETPWTREDYLSAIRSLEAEITPRRLREAVVSAGGFAHQWLVDKEAEIAVLREELAAL